LEAAVPEFHSKSSGVYLRGDGCNRCVPEFADTPEAQRHAPGAGIYGRTLVAEIVHPTQHHLDIALHHGVPAARRKWLEDGGQLIIDHAIEKIMDGILSPQIVEDFLGEIKPSRFELEEFRRSTSPVSFAQKPPPARALTVNAAS